MNTYLVYLSASSMALCTTHEISNIIAKAIIGADTVATSNNIIRGIEGESVVVGIRQSSLSLQRGKSCFAQEYLSIDIHSK